jgi:riboflavin synthase
MFTGLIEETGRVRWLKQTRNSIELQINARKVLNGLQRGDSLAVNGCCLTATSIRQDLITFDLLEETLRKTNLHALRPDTLVNLERPLAANARFGGHFVQGHIDCTAKVVSVEARGADHRLEVALPAEFAHLVAYKGSIAIDGISLTVAEVTTTSFVVWVIPHTWDVTNLSEARSGTLVNLEFDILAKYVERLRTVHPAPVR